LVLALQAVRDLAPDPNFVVNMSIGWSNWKTTADCPGNWLPMTNMVKDLHDRGIPVIVSAGNEGTVGNRFGVNFPSCVPHTVKVAATLNDGNGNTIAPASNIVPQGSLTGPVLLAPGYSVTSAMATGPTDVAADGGTSMAAPQVAGYYAVLKAALPGFTLPDITAWIMSSGSVPVTLTANGITYNFRRIKAPL
jgi:subtilisin family serine protease